MNMDVDQTMAYLDHAKERMEQRGITPQEVEEALSNISETLPGKLPGKVRVFGATSAGRKLSITKFQEKAVVVSAVSLEGPSI